MKRKLALLILMILALSIVLAACGQTETTKIEIRWTPEDYTFNITLADFVGTTNEFRKYRLNTDTYYKDVAITGEVFSELDEIRPLDVDGTYKLSIQKVASDDFWTVTSDQTIYAQYNKAKITLIETDLEAITATDTEIAQTTLKPIDGVETIILRSTTQTEVLFKDTIDQTPISSKTKVNGFYIGEQNQQVTSYTVETTYNTGENRPVASISYDGAEAVDYTFDRGAKFIDSNQLLMYIRSLDKSYANGFPSSTMVQVFNPYTQEILTASFGLTHDANMILTDSQRQVTVGDSQQVAEVYTSVNIVTVAIGGFAFMQQENLPDTLKSVDLHAGSGNDSDKPKYTTVRFRVGYLAYELETYPDSVWNALNAPADADAE